MEGFIFILICLSFIHIFRLLGGEKERLKIAKALINEAKREDLDDRTKIVLCLVSRWLLDNKKESINFSEVIK